MPSHHDRQQPTPVNESDDRATVVALLAMHGIDADAEDINAIVALFPARRAAAEALHAVAAARQESPAVRFDPEGSPRCSDR